MKGDDFIITKVNVSENINVNNKTSYLVFKRIADIVVSFLGLIVLLLPMLIISLIIFIDSPGASPVFIQKRVGKGGKEFRFFKFRSMIPNAEDKLEELLSKNEMDGPAFKMENDPRITRFGRFIRRSSIDELPQLLNVLVGNMSLVGPRPPLPREVEMYNEEQLARLLVKPGMTCYWQTKPKRNSLSFDEWLECDIKYIKNRSLKTDVKILFATVRTVFGMEGI